MWGEVCRALDLINYRATEITRLVTAQTDNFEKMIATLLNEGDWNFDSWYLFPTGIDFDGAKNVLANKSNRTQWNSILELLTKKISSEEPIHTSEADQNRIRNFIKEWKNIVEKLLELYTDFQNAFNVFSTVWLSLYDTEIKTSAPEGAASIAGKRLARAREREKRRRILPPLATVPPPYSVRIEKLCYIL